MGIFVDLSKEFDLIKHSNLLGAHMKSVVFLRNLAKATRVIKKQFWNIGGVTWNITGITCSVPQGSILDHFLFLLRINAVLHYLQANTALYADDTNIFVEADGLTELYRKSNYTLTMQLHACLFRDLLTLRTNETSFVIIHQK